MKKDYDLSTRCVHAGEVRDAEGSPHTPIYNTTTFGFRSTADLLDVVEGRRPGNLYTRYGLNPTIRSVEAKLASSGKRGVGPRVRLGNGGGGGALFHPRPERDRLPG